MTSKPGLYAILEGIQSEMRANKNLTMFWQDRPVAVSPSRESWSNGPRDHPWTSVGAITAPAARTTHATPSRSGSHRRE